MGNVMMLFRAVMVMSIVILALPPSLATDLRTCDIPRSNVPPAATRNGYNTRTFHSEFDNLSVDIRDTRDVRFKWYLGQFFGWPATVPTAVTINTDNTVTLRGEIARINTAAPKSDGKGWTGVAFGGGAFIRAVLKFDPDISLEGAKSWPGFWSMAIEHFAGEPSEQWAGQSPGYAHFIEPDFFEYDLPKSILGGKRYGGALHEWYGIYGRTCVKIYCSVSNVSGVGSRFSNFIINVPPETDFSEYHEYGFLWVPASKDTPGFAQYYFDGVATKNLIHWSLFEDQAPPPTMKPWAFGIIDRQHLVLVLQTGANSTMTVGCVEVWQRSDSGNLIHK